MSRSRVSFMPFVLSVAVVFAALKPAPPEEIALVPPDSVPLARTALIDWFD